MVDQISGQVDQDNEKVDLVFDMVDQWSTKYFKAI